MLSLYEKEELIVQRRTVIGKEKHRFSKYLNETGFHVVKKHLGLLLKKTEVQKWLTDYTTSFCSHIKHG